MTSARSERADRARRLFLLAVAISVFGWLGETVYAYGISGQLCDRGFLTLPLCPIYGVTVLSLYWLLGVPQGGGVLLRRVRGWRRLLFYLPICLLLPTAIELVTGWLFHRLLGLRLWDYSGKPWNVGGYVCLPFSLLWGVALPLGMATVFPPLKRLFFSWSAKSVRIGVWLLALGLALDLTWLLWNKTLA